MSKAFSDEELRLALIGYYDAVAEASEPAPGQHFSYSPGHIARMEKLIRRSENRQRRILTLQRVAAVLLAFLITAATWLAVDVHARESFFTWVRTVYEDHIVYRFHGSSTTTDSLPNYELGWVPEGSKLVEEDRQSTFTSRIYENDSTGKGTVFDYSFMGGVLYISHYSKVESIDLGSFKGEYYAPSYEGDSCEIMWIDDTKGIIFQINSTESKEDVIKMAKSVYCSE